MAGNDGGAAVNAPLERKIRVRGEILLMAMLAKGDGPETRKLQAEQLTQQ